MVQCVNKSLLVVTVNSLPLKDSNQKDRRQVCILSEKMGTHFSRVNGMESIFYSDIKVS